MSNLTTNCPSNEGQAIVLKILQNEAIRFIICLASHKQESSTDSSSSSAFESLMYFVNPTRKLAS